MPQIIRSKDTGEQFVGDGPVPDGFEVVKPSGPRPLTESDIGGQMLKNAQRTIPQGVPSLADMGKAAVAPTVGAIGAGMLGQRLAGRAGRMAGESVGSAAGTGVNMAMGLQPPSVGGLFEAAAAPLEGRVLGQLGGSATRSTAKMLPGSAAARHEIAKSTMEAIPDLVKPGTPSGVMYQQLRTTHANTLVPVAALKTAVDDLLVQEKNTIWNGLKDGSRQKMLEGLQGDLATVTHVPFPVYWDNVKRIGEKVGSLQTSGGEALGAAKLLYKGGMTDLDQIPALKAANTAFKKERAADELHGVVMKQGIAPRADGIVTVRATAVRKWLQNPDNADTVKNLDPGDLKAIDAVLKKIEKLPANPPQTGVMHGFGGIAGRAAGGGLLGTYVGGPSGGAVGAMVTTVGGQMISRALMSEPGRKALMMVLDKGAFLDYPKLAALAVAINAGAKVPPPASE